MQVTELHLNLIIDECPILTGVYFNVIVVLNQLQKLALPLIRKLIRQEYLFSLRTGRFWLDWQCMFKFRLILNNELPIISILVHSSTIWLFLFLNNGSE